jgi:hypothetical protein
MMRIWSLILREEHKLNLFEKKILKRIFFPPRGRGIGSGEIFILEIS